MDHVPVDDESFISFLAGSPSGLKGVHRVAIREYVRIFVKFWWVIVVFAVIGAAGGYAYSVFFQDSGYAATSRLFATAEGGSSVGESYQNNLFAQERVNSYAAIATSDQVARRASAALGGAVSADTLRAHTTAAAIDKTVIMAVTVTDASPRRAQSYANAVAQQTAVVVQELETSRRGGGAAATAIVLDDADLPSTPVGFSVWILLIMGVAAGLVVGILVAVGLALLDRRVRDSAAVTTSSGHHLLAEIPTSDLYVEAAVTGSGEGMEPFRTLRTNIRFIGAAASANGTSPRVITVTGPGAGVGRTTVALGLAGVLADSGHDVLLIDADLAGNGIARAISITSDKGLSSAVVGEGDLVSNVVRLRENLAVLPAGKRPPTAGELISSEGFDEVLAQARRRFDFVVLDTPATDASTSAAVCAALSDATVVLARLNRTTRPGLKSSVESLVALGVQVVGVAVTHATVSGASEKATAGSERG